MSVSVPNRMLSFKSPTKADSALPLGIVSGPDFDADSRVFMYEDADKAKVHFGASYQTSLLLKDKYDSEIISRKNGRTVSQGSAVPLESVGQAIQLYGLNKFSLAAETAPGQVKAVLLCASPGAGKSYFIGQYMDNWRKLYPEGKIIVFSRKRPEDEPEFRQEYKQINVETREFIESPITVDECKPFADKGILAVFDDTSTFSREVCAAIHATMDDFVKVGRSSNVHVIMSNHNINDGARTKTMHNSATTTVLFPNSHKEKVIEYFQKRLKMSQAATDFLMDQPTRWILIQHSTPQYIMTENQVFMLNALTDSFRKRGKK